MTVLYRSGQRGHRRDGGDGVFCEKTTDVRDGGAVTYVARLVVGGDADGGGEIVCGSDNLLGYVLGWV